jgi:TolB protein
LFFALEKKSFIQRPEPAHNKPRFEDWAFIKTQVLVTGKISLEKEGRLRVEFKLWDVVSATELSALAFYTTPDNWRRVSHMISDKIYERLTGEKGYFDTRIVYVAESGNWKRKVILVLWTSCYVNLIHAMPMNILRCGRRILVNKGI